MLFWFASRVLTPKISFDDLVLSTVKQGLLENGFSARGTVKPASEITINAPIASQIEKVFVNSGTSVTKGAQLLKLKDDATILEYNKLEDELSLKRNNVARLQLSLKKNIQDIELDNKIKNLQIKSYRAQYEDAQRLFEISGTTKEDVEQAKQNLDIAILEKAKLENELKYRRASYEADVKNEQLQSSIQNNVLQQLGSKINKMTVKSPAEGVLTWISEQIGSQVNEGAPVAKISNLSSFYIEGVASDRHSEKLALGQVVKVRINNEYLNGHIEQILPSVENNSIKFKVELDQTDADLLKNNMNVELFVVIENIPDAIYMARGKAFNGAKAQDFFVLEDDVLVRKTLQLGISTMKEIQIISGAQLGDQIVISDMDDYENRKTIPLKDLKK